MKVLVITQRLPYAPNRGDRLRAYHQIRQLRAQGWTVDVLALVHDGAEAAQVDSMRAEGLRVEVAAVPHVRNKIAGVMSLLGARPLTLTLLDSPDLEASVARLTSEGLPDVVLACSSSMAAVAMRPPLSRVPMAIDFVDVDSQKWRALGESTRGPLSWIYRREHRALQGFEALVAGRAFVSLLTTERERVALEAFAPDARVEVLPNGIDLERFARPDDAVTEPRVVFTGVMNYAPNADAAVWLAREIWPLVRSRRPDVALDIVGATPTPSVQALEDGKSGIHVSGSVPDVRPYLWRAHAAVAPLRVARGVQNKVLEAAAAGLPSVVTPSVHAGLPTALQSLCPVGETASQVADRLVDVLQRPVAHEIWSHAVAGMGWGTTLAPLGKLLTPDGRPRLPCS